MGLHPLNGARAGLETRAFRALFVALVIALALVVVPAARADGPYEPNDTNLTPYGPLLGGQDYNGAFETQNDVDYFFVYTPGVVQMRVTLTNPQPDVYGYCGVDMRFARPDNGDPVGDDVYVSRTSYGTLTYTSIGARQYLLVIRNGCSGSDYNYGPQMAYKLHLDPSSAFVATPPPTPVSADCVKANASAAALVRKINALKRQLKKTKGRHKRNRVKKIINSKRVKLRNAQQNSNYECSQPAEY